MAAKGKLKGERFELSPGDDGFPEPLQGLKQPPERLYGIGDPSALQEGLAVIGSRRATPYGISCARHFATLAAQHGIAILSGGARGCDAEAHRAAVDNGAPTVVFLGGGCDWVYPAENFGLFQSAVAGGGAVVSEYPWETEPRPFMFRLRNRLISGLAKATLIVEAGIPSGTFSTAEDANDADREVWAVPGSLASAQSSGANLLISEGAQPIVGDDCFATHLSRLFGVGDGCARPSEGAPEETAGPFERRLVDALRAQPLTLDQIVSLVRQGGRDDAYPWTMTWLARSAPRFGIAKYPNGRYGPVVR